MTKAIPRKRTGTLRIGNQWNAINIIARSQTHPLKAVCELTENSIDAKAKQIQVVRRKSKGQIFLELSDDGAGVSCNQDGEPDFARIATHVCDSMKRHLKAQDRQGVHGEFGIGLLSFWSLGSELRMIASGSKGRVFEMQLVRGERNYSVRQLRSSLALGGTRVIVGPLLESTRKVVTGDKLSRYLSSELRNRIRSTGVQIRIIDRVSRKDLVVKPREFEGDRVELPARVATPRGELTLELYFAARSDEQDAGVAVCKDGTRVLKDITELVQFQHTPWTDRRLEGVIDFASLNLAPGTRSGIVPDDNLVAFVQAVQGLESAILAAIEQRDQAESDKASRDILRQVHRAFRNALRELPSNEYLFFDIPEPKHSLGESPGNGKGDADGIILPEKGPSEAAAEEAESEPTLFALEPGMLASVRITPRHARRRPGEECRLAAQARDENRIRITQGVEYSWEILDGQCLLASDTNTARVAAQEPAEVKVAVRALQADTAVEDQVTVKFLENAPEEDDSSARGLPSYRLEPEHGKPWRSRYDVTLNEIIINSAHRDFLSSKTTAAKHRRYIGKLYAKEVVLINFPHGSPDEVMERLIELTLRTEDVL